MKEDRSNMADIKAFLTDNAEKSRDYLIKHLMTMFNFTESTARTYYYKWKQEFMKPTVPKRGPLLEDAIKAQREEKKKLKETAEIKLNEPNPPLEKIDKETPQEVKEETKEPNNITVYETAKVETEPKGVKTEIKESDILTGTINHSVAVEPEELGLKVSHKVVMMNIEGKGHNFYIEIQGLNNKTPYMKIMPNEHCKDYPEEISEAYKTFVKLLEL